MSRGPQKNSLASQIVAALSEDVATPPVALAVQFVRTADAISTILNGRARGIGDVKRVKDGWVRVRTVETEAAKLQAVAEAECAALAARHEKRLAEAWVGEKAGPRTFQPTGEWRPPAVPMRPGAMDFLGVASRVGDARVPYRQGSNMSTTATAAGPRSGLK